jgi:hypothetical protein
MNTRDNHLEETDEAERDEAEPLQEERDEAEPLQEERDEAEPLEEDTEYAADDSLVSEDSALDYRNRWETIQADFIDEPRRSVEEADGLVAEVIEEVARTFQEQRLSLEARWTDDEDVSTEDLRVALRLYRSFFERLLST